MLDNRMMAFGVENALCSLNLRLNQACKTEKCLISLEDAGLDTGGVTFTRVDSLSKNHLIVANTDVDAQKMVESRVEVYRSQEFDKPTNAKAKFLEGCCRVDSFHHHDQFCSVYPSQDSCLSFLKEIINSALNIVSIAAKQLSRSSLCYNQSLVAKYFWHFWLISCTGKGCYGVDCYSKQVLIQAHQTANQSGCYITDKHSIPDLNVEL
ncbi:hypothetical protein I8748_04775 [Nostoc sp. CENA67]|uniref:Uncharacterized protein n=1 Tax=Amazonocrinis nigriterrae CENA67 TaxID=2794033 RepID=A0A8J7HQF9_9NOST|nr:hypothetical protein [Amazonocrinis nigriterrae]MBH8561497.1 hypothetical protein [Amazonocrinis nigriterrae CENA67]